MDDRAPDLHRLVLALRKMVEAVEQLSAAGIEEETDPQDQQWDRFLGEHPELLEEELPKSPPSDETILGVLALLVEKTRADVSDLHRHGAPFEHSPHMRARSSAVHAHDVSRAYYETAWSPTSRVHRKAVGTVASRLARLARQGQVVRLVPRFSGGTCMWSLPGQTLERHVTADYVVATATGCDDDA